MDGEEDKAEETMEDSDVDFTKMRNLRTRQPAGHAMNFDLVCVMFFGLVCVCMLCSLALCVFVCHVL